MATRPQISIVIPVFNEGDGINACLDRILNGVRLPCEVIVVYDNSNDTTVPYIEKYARQDDRVISMLNTDAPGPAQAIRFGYQSWRGCLCTGWLKWALAMPLIRLRLIPPSLFDRWGLSRMQVLRLALSL